MDLQKTIFLGNYFETLQESLDIKEGHTVDKAILFTDMVGSSKAWKSNPEDMIIALEEQSKLIDQMSSSHKGFICKSIGDAFMIVFKKAENALECGLAIQKSLKDNPIKITKGLNTVLRIGICYGPIFESEIKLQNKILKDFYGNTVNTASRIESGVADNGGVAFAIVSDDADEIELDPILKDYKVDLISFTNTGEEIKRSSRTLTDIHRHIYKNIKELKGIDEIDVYKIKI